LKIGKVKKMKYTRRKVWFTGSRKSIERTIYYSESLNIYYVKWGGQNIEVVETEKGSSHWYTVEPY